MPSAESGARADEFASGAALRRKLADLEAHLGRCGRVAVAFSGGVDSAVLLAVARRVLGPEVIALTAVSPSLAAEELAGARGLARTLEVELVEVPTGEMEDPRYRANGPDRCFHCKSHVFRALGERARQRGIDVVVEGSNGDDAHDHRPGMAAARALGVRSPLLEAGLTKAEVRALACDLDLPVWDKPAAPCLASRVPYFDEVTAAKLDQIERAERFLREQGFGVVRVRHHGAVARIEVEPERIAELTRPEMRARVETALGQLGFGFVAVDLGGFRSGKLDRLLDGRVPGEPGASSCCAVDPRTEAAAGPPRASE
ncbi:MAG: ATP-dependent sacrificial sulfur transferase LarE [Planctomycetes bacterium]|nr:ATP-dependent sacrificial sulfur transferase LarE [Planctomycetota bacterium]